MHAFKKKVYTTTTMFWLNLRLMQHIQRKPALFIAIYHTIIEIMHVYGNFKIKMNIMYS